MRYRMKTIKTILTVLSICQVIFTFCPLIGATELENVTIQLKWLHQFQFAGYYAAVEKGFYAEEGLNVVLRERDPSKGHIQSVLDGDVEYGVADVRVRRTRSSMTLSRTGSMDITIRPW